MQVNNVNSHLLQLDSLNKLILVFGTKLQSIKQLVELSSKKTACAPSLMSLLKRALIRSTTFAETKHHLENKPMLLPHLNLKELKVTSLRASQPSHQV